MKIKALLGILLITALLTGLAGCGNSDSSQNSTQPTVKDTAASGVQQSTDTTATQSVKTSVSATPAVPFEPVSGKTVDAGNVRAVCPEGWYNLPARDVFSEEEGALDPDKLIFQKFSDEEYTNLPNVVISFYGVGETFMSYEEQLEYYSENAKLLPPFMIGETVWEGLTYPLGDDVTEVLISKQGNGDMSVGIRLEGEGESIAITDADVQTILTSIEY